MKRIFLIFAVICCTVLGNAQNEHKHQLIHHPVDIHTYTDYTCEYWHCIECGKNFADATGENELTDFQVDLSHASVIGVLKGKIAWGQWIEGYSEEKGVSLYYISDLTYNRFQIYPISSAISIHLDENKDWNKIGTSVFEKFQNLRTFTIPSSVQSIETKAFYLCSNLEYVKCDAVCSCADDAFTDCGKEVGGTYFLCYNVEMMSKLPANSLKMAYYNVEDLKKDVLNEITTQIEGKSIVKSVEDAIELYITNIQTTTDMETVLIEKKKIMTVMELCNHFQSDIIFQQYIDLITQTKSIAALAQIKDDIQAFPYFIVNNEKHFLVNDASENYSMYKENTFTFLDASLYKSNYKWTVGTLNYTRNMTPVEGVWQSWYVPFNVEVDNTQFDAAEVAGILVGEDDNTVIAFRKLDDGATMHANTAYVIRAKSGMGNFDWELSNVTMYPSTENSFTLQSAYDNFRIGGNYSSQANTSWYALNTKGTFQKMAANVNLRPQRFWLTRTKRTGSDAHYGTDSYPLKSSIGITVLDDNENPEIPNDGGNTMGIDEWIEISAPWQYNGSQIIIYDQLGRKVSNIQKGQIYFINGKKFFVQ